MTMAANQRLEVAIVGGGLTGAALAYGLRDLGKRLGVLDAGETDGLASRGNFGLVWVQGKGHGVPAYGNWTQASAREWPRLAADLRAQTGIDVGLAQPGGLHACLSRGELDARAERLDRVLAQPGFEPYPLEVLDHAAIAARLPGIGPDVVGGTWCPLDGHCDPLRLLRALRLAAARAGVGHGGGPVGRIEPLASGFRLHTPSGPIEADRVVLAAGLGNATLAPMVGLAAPVRPNKGQVLVLERRQPFLPFPLETIRQTDDGTVLLGDSQEDAGFDTMLGLDVLGAIARRAVRVLPALAGVRVIRAWAALRVLTPDGLPIYAHSAAHPGASLVTCHSGVTLAAAHALLLAPSLGEGRLPDRLDAFGTGRFDDVRAAA